MAPDSGTRNGEAASKAVDEPRPERFYVPSGTKIFSEDDPGDAVYLIREGRVEVSKRKSDGRHVVLAELGPGEILGELALLDDQPRMATALALEETELVKVPKAMFVRQYEALNPVMRMMVSMLAQRMREMAKDLAGRDPLEYYRTYYRRRR